MRPIIDFLQKVNAFHYSAIMLKTASHFLAKQLFASFSLVFSFLILSNTIVGQTYTTTGAANNWQDPATWNCVGGGCKTTPGVPLKSGVQVNILDSVFYGGNTLKISDGEIFISNGGKMKFGSGINSGVNFVVEKKGKLKIEDGSISLGPPSNGGGNNSNFLNQGVIELTKAYVSILKNCTNEGTIILNDACFTITDGNFANVGQLQGTGSVKIEGGNLTSSGSWSSDIAYCASGSYTGNLPGSPDCTLVTKACDCLKDPCVIENPDILPGYDPTTRNEDLIGSELTALSQNPASNDNQDIFVFGGAQDVLIDIIYFEGQFGNVVNILNANFGISPSSFINNGFGSQVITLFFPIADLPALNTFPNDINFVRPTPPGVTGNNSSLNNQGDFAQESFFTRAGFDLSGEGIKIGVLSDSYNQNGDQGALQDVSSGVLPGATNPNGFNSEVEVLADYPFGAANDEGRAMLQIVHSVAPKADLAFHTGFVSPGNFAEGIRALADANCDLIVDDITYITEPFFTDANQGVVAQAVAEVTAEGVDYFTSAGNFASRAYESLFTPGPPGANQNNHDFGGGDFLQKLTLGVGDYLIVFQWADDFYSIDGGSGAQNDLDFYLADDNGNLIYGFNRNNFGEDPIEVMPFTVINPTTTNLLIKRVSGTANMPIRYIVFKAGDGNNGFSAEYFNNASTIVGHANSPEAITVGAVRYEDTPNFGGVLETEPFSSTGDPMTALKPDFTAPDGGNVTVDLGGGDYSGDADNLPNFFGTSAAAPHAAGVAALLLEAQNKFDESFDIRTKLKNTAVNYGEPAYISGAGFINSFDAVSSFANPSPQLILLNTDALTEGQNPGDVAFTLVVEGSFLTDQTLVYFRGEVLEPISQTETSISVIIPPFIGNPAIWVQTAPITNSGNDGGADSLYFSDPVLTPVAIKVNESTKKFGEALPAFTFTTDPALAPEFMALLPPLIYSTQADDLSDVGIYGVTAAFDLNEGAELDPALQELFEFTFEGDFLTIEKADLLITPNSFSVSYGEQIQHSDITFSYDFGEGLNIPSKTVLQNQLAEDHQSSIADDIAVLRNISLANISLANISLANKAFIASYNSLQNISLANISLANGMNIIEVDARLFEETQHLQQGTDFIGNISLANFISLANTRANILGGTARPDYLLTNISLANISLANISLANISLANFISLANISLANISLANISLANGETILDFQLPLRNFISLANNNNTDIISILAEEDIGEQDVPLIPVNLITGLEAGEQYIVPAAFLSNTYSKNFNITYAPGTLNIQPLEVAIKVDDASVIYGEEEPTYSVAIASTSNPLPFDDLPGDLIAGFTLRDATGPVNYGPAGTFTVHAIPNNNPNYILNLLPGELTVEKATLHAFAENTSRTYGATNPPIGISYEGFVNEEGAEVILTPPTIFTETAPNANVGAYPITLGSDGVAANYEIVPVGSGVLTITRAVLTITAVDDYVQFGEPLPTFIYSISGFVGADLFDDVFSSTSAIELSLDRPVPGNIEEAPGAYIIMVTVNETPVNYDLQTVNGLFVYNPDKGFKIQTFAECVTFDPDPAYPGFDYLGTFRYTNRNEAPYFSEFGSNNTFTGPGSIIGKPVELIVAGGGFFDIRFDGKRIRWEVSSYGSTNKTSPLDKNDQGCNNAALISLNLHNGAPEQKLNYNFYPNPVTDIAIIELQGNELPFGKEEETSIELYNLVGKLIQVKINRPIEGQHLEIDMTNVPAGVYFVKIKKASEDHVFKVIKK